MAWQNRRRSRHEGKKGRDVRGDSELNGVSQSFEDTIKGEGHEAGDAVTLCILGSERDAIAMLQTAVAPEGKRRSQRADLLLRKGYTDLFERSSRAQCQQRTGPTSDANSRGAEGLAQTSHPDLVATCGLCDDDKVKGTSSWSTAGDKECRASRVVFLRSKPR